MHMREKEKQKRGNERKAMDGKGDNKRRQRWREMRSDERKGIKGGEIQRDTGRSAKSKGGERVRGKRVKE